MTPVRGASHLLLFAGLALLATATAPSARPAPFQGRPEPASAQVQEAPGRESAAVTFVYPLGTHSMGSVLAEVVTALERQRYVILEADSIRGVVRTDWKERAWAAIDSGVTLPFQTRYDVRIGIDPPAVTISPQKRWPPGPTVDRGQADDISNVIVALALGLGGSVAGSTRGSGLDGSPEIDAFALVADLPVAVRIPPPKYPADARRAGVSGEVKVRTLVGDDGRVWSAYAFSGPEPLRNVATDAVLGGIFKPALGDDGPIPTWVVIPIEFKLSN